MRHQQQNSSSYNGKYSVAPLSVTNLKINSNNIASTSSSSSSVFFYNNNNNNNISSLSKNNCHSYRRQNTYSVSSSGESPVPNYNGNTRRKYHNTMTRQYSNESGDGSSFYKSSPNSFSDRNELRNTRFSSNSGTGYRRSNNGRQGGKTVYNSDVLREGRSSFSESFSCQASQPIRFDRRKF